MPKQKAPTKAKLKQALDPLAQETSDFASVEKPVKTGFKFTTPVIVLVGMVLLLTAAGAFFGYRYFSDSADDAGPGEEEEVAEEDVEEIEEVEEIPTEEVEEVAEEDEDADVPEEEEPTPSEVPEGWTQLDNSSQGYTAYKPPGWYHRFFGIGMQTLGIDTNAIPEASEYAGVIALTHVEGVPMSEWLTSQTSGLKPGYTETSGVYGEYTWNILEGEYLASDVFFPDYKVKYAYMEVEGRLFIAELMASPSAYSGYTDEFDIFIGTVLFWE